MRPTKWCNPREPLVIALANELGAYELSDYEFAETAYWWVNTHLATEIVLLNDMSETMKRGTGGCAHMVAVFLALCEAAGIKGGYKFFKTMLDDVLWDLNMDQILDLTEEEQATISRVFNIQQGHYEGEVCIDSKRVVAHVEMRPEIHAHSGVPIMRFEEDSIMLARRLVPGSVRYYEELDTSEVGRAFMTIIRFSSTVRERSNIVLSGTLPLGKKIIEEACGKEAYNRKARKKRSFSGCDTHGARVARL